MRTLLFIWLFSCLGVTCAQAALTKQRPNIIFIITDDQGYGDFSCHGNPILKTPNLDRLHEEGARFTDFHVSPTCAPTRSALLTGRHEFKNGVTHTINERERLALGAKTFPQALQRSGYRTGIFGKWHLGDEPAYWPDKRGFDEMFIHGAGGIGQSYPGSCGDAPGNTYFDPAILHNGTFVKTKGYCTDVFFTQALRWMDEKRQGDAPFYCHIATNAPHLPLQVRPEDEARYAGQVPPQTAKFFGMVANIDDNVGRLLGKLREWKLEETTLIVFMNDNGGTVGTKVHNAGMRGSKVTPWLGGTRAASFWRWKGTLTPGDRSQLAAHLDFFPTVAEIAGLTLTTDERQQIEGLSLVPALMDAKAAWPERTLFTHVGRWDYGKSPETGKYKNASVRTTRWHLVSEAKPSNPKAAKTPETPAAQQQAASPAWQLFDLNTDRGEQRNVAADHPEVVAAMTQSFETWWTSLKPLLVNETAPLAAENPFKTLFLKQQSTTGIKELGP